MRKTYALTLAVLVATSATAEVQLFGPSGTTHFSDVGPFSESQREGLEEFQHETLYYGAFFIEEGGTSWGYYNGANRLEDAFDLGLRICASESRSNSCTLAAVILPSDATTGALTPSTLNADAAQAFTEYGNYSEGYRAFAASRNTAYGWAAERRTLTAAITAAMGFCENYSNGNAREFIAELRQGAITDGLFECAIVDTSGPGD